MKKLMKALALATVMCMLMSVAAFASEATLADEATKTLNITVDTATGAEQVALVIVDAGKEIASGNIVFAGQTAAVDGTAAFTATIAADVEAVDVYAGNATYAAANNTAELVAEDLALTASITEATVTVVETKIAEGTQNDADPNHTGGGVGMIVNFELPTGVTPVKVIWSIRSGEDDVYYTDSIDISGLSVLEGDVQLGASFINGSIADGVEPITIDGAHAIFLFSDQSEVYTDEATDKPNKAE